MGEADYTNLKKIVLDILKFPFYFSSNMTPFIKLSQQAEVLPVLSPYLLFFFLAILALFLWITPENEATYNNSNLFQ